MQHLLKKAPCPIKNLNVTVTFHGLICHVLKGSVTRAVAISGSTNSPHVVSLRVPLSVDQTALKNLGFTVSKQGSEYRVDGIDGYALRIVGWDPKTSTVTPLSSLDTSDKSFQDEVPHLQAVTDGTMTTLKTTVYDPLPDKNDFTAFFELEGGSLSALPYCKKAHFKNDYEKKKDREFAEYVTLCAIASPQPAIQFRNAGGWITPPVTFSGSAPIDIALENVEEPAPSVPGSDMLFVWKLAASAVKTDDVSGIVCPKKGAVPGCSDTQWP